MYVEGSSKGKMSSLSLGRHIDIRQLC